MPKGQHCHPAGASTAWLHAGFKAGNPGHPHNPCGARGGFSKPPLPHSCGVPATGSALPRSRGRTQGERELVQMQPVDLNGSRHWPTFPWGDPALSRTCPLLPRQPAPGDYTKQVEMSPTPVTFPAQSPRHRREGAQGGGIGTRCPAVAWPDPRLSHSPGSLASGLLKLGLEER